MSGFIAQICGFPSQQVIPLQRVWCLVQSIFAWELVACGYPLFGWLQRDTKKTPTHVFFVSAWFFGRWVGVRFPSQTTPNRLARIAGGAVGRGATDRAAGEAKPLGRHRPVSAGCFFRRRGGFPVVSCWVSLKWWCLVSSIFQGLFFLLLFFL